MAGVKALHAIISLWQSRSGARATARKNLNQAGEDKKVSGGNFYFKKKEKEAN